jgi:hypothetical protein
VRFSLHWSVKCLRWGGWGISRVENGSRKEGHKSLWNVRSVEEEIGVYCRE